MADKYFISYRRKSGGDSQALQVADIMKKYVGEKNVFFDRQSIGEGTWTSAIDDGISAADHFLLIVNEASTVDDECVYYYEIKTALKSDKLKKGNGRITMIVYHQESLTKLVEKFPELNAIQKITFNGEYGDKFEERICKHFGFKYNPKSKSSDKMTQTNVDGRVIVDGDVGGNVTIINNTSANPSDTSKGDNNSNAGKWILIILLLSAAVAVFVFVKRGGSVSELLSDPTEAKVQRVLDSAINNMVDPPYDIFDPECNVYEVSGSSRVFNGTIDQHLMNLGASREIKVSKLVSIKKNEKGLVMEIEVKDIR